MSAELNRLYFQCVKFDIFRPVNVHRTFSTQFKGHGSEMFVGRGPDDLAYWSASREEDIVKALPEKLCCLTNSPCDHLGSNLI